MAYSAVARRVSERLLIALAATNLTIPCAAASIGVDRGELSDALTSTGALYVTDVVALASLVDQASAVFFAAS